MISLFVQVFQTDESIVSHSAQLWVWFCRYLLYTNLPLLLFFFSCFFLFGLSKERHLVVTQKPTFLISWNLPDFVQISWNLADFRWNPADFTWNPPNFVWISIGGFCVDFRWNPPTKLINQIFQEKLFSFMECCGKAISCFHMKSAGFRKTNCQEW